MNRKIYLVYIPVNSRMWAGDHITLKRDISSIEELKMEIGLEDVEFVNVLDNLALANYLRDAGVEVDYKERKENEKKDYIIANPGDVIYELFGNFSPREVKTEEDLPKFTSIVIRRWVNIKEN